jgi:hypothetical protein
VGALVPLGLVTALLLSLAGAQKLLDPSMTVGALRALRLPASDGLVRLGSAVELALGVAAIVAGGASLWGAVAVSYLAFALFVVAALRRGTMIGSCGCFGREETPPHWSHVVLNGALATAAGAMAWWETGSVLDALAGSPTTSAVVLPLGALALVLLQAAYVDLPRTLLAGRRIRGAT